MVTSKDWPAFPTEFRKLQILWDTYHDSKVVYETRSSNIKQTFLQDMLAKRSIFSRMSTRRSLTGLILAILFLRIHTKIYFCISPRKNSICFRVGKQILERTQRLKNWAKSPNLKYLQIKRSV